MNLNEAKQILKNAGYIVENAISFEQEAKNIVYSYGVDEYGLDVDQIVKIMEDASKFKEQHEQIDYITNQFKKITGLTIWDIEDDENLEAAHFDICNTVYKHTRNKTHYDPDDGTRRQFKADGVNPVDGTYDGVYESTKLKEAIEILEQQGYRVVLNESAQIDEAINNPDEPASKKQLWALYCITKQDWRDKNLTKGEAFELIQKYSGERPQKSAVTGKSLDSKIKEDIMSNLKPKLDKQMAKAFGLQSVVGDADLEGNLIPGGKRYKFFGSGCGWAWVKYDKRNKKLGEILDKYDDIYRHGYFEKFANEYIKKFKEREMGAVLSQDIDIQCIIKQAALDFAESIGINVKGAYVNSHLD